MSIENFFYLFPEHEKDFFCLFTWHESFLFLFSRNFSASLLSMKKRPSAQNEARVFKNKCFIFNFEVCSFASMRRKVTK